MWWAVETVDGVPRELRGFLIDITQRKQFEIRLRESEAKFRALAENSRATITLNDEQGFTYVNPRLEELTGYTRTELLEMDLGDLLHPDIRKVVVERARARLRGEDLPSYDELPFLTKHGKTRWVEVASTGVDLDGKRVTLATCVDITERKQTERALQENEAKFRALAENSHATITLSDDQHFIYVNPRAEEVTGYTQTELLSMKFADLLPPDVQPVIVERAQARLRGEDASHHYELPFLKKDGETRWLDVTATVVEMGGQVLSLATGIDITERKQADAEIRSLTGRVLTAREDEQQRLARDLHDGFNQRLAAISIDIGLIRQRGSDVPRDVRRELATVQDAVVEVSQDLQRVARDLHPPALAQVGLVRALDRHCREVSQRTGITVHFSADLGDRSVSPGMSLCLYRIAQESLRNVVQHSKAETADVTVTARPESLQLSITDGGIGFDPKVSHGRGLGLISLEERVRSLNGRLLIQSESDVGTEILVRIPWATRGNMSRQGTAAS